MKTQSSQTVGFLEKHGLNEASKKAALAYAEGRDDEAKKHLVDHLNQTKGEAEKIVWYMLLDIHQIRKDKAQFGKIADLFAKKFSHSPPSWKEDLESREILSGRNVLNLQGGITQSNAAKIKDFLQAAENLAYGQINFAEMVLAQTDRVGISLITSTLSKLREKRVKISLIDPMTLIDTLKEKIEQSAHQEEWLLLMELLQWSAAEEEFEEFAFQYANRYDLSPPGFDTIWGREDAIKNTTESLMEPRDKVIGSDEMKNWLQTTKNHLSKNHQVEMDVSFERVERISTEGIDYWLDWLKSNKEFEFSKKISIVGINHLILGVLEIKGVLPHLKVMKKKSV